MKSGMWLTEFLDLKEAKFGDLAGVIARTRGRNKLWHHSTAKVTLSLFMNIQKFGS